MDLAGLICKAILILIGIIAVIVFGACACAPLMMGKDNKSIVDQDSEPECELDGGKCDCYDCWKK